MVISNEIWRPQAVLEKKLASIEVGPTTLARPTTLTLTFNPLRAMLMTYSHAKVQSQWSVGSEDRVETNGRTDGGDCITSLANVIGYQFTIKLPQCFMICSTLPMMRTWTSWEEEWMTHCLESGHNYFRFNLLSWAFSDGIYLATVTPQHLSAVRSKEEMNWLRVRLENDHYIGVLFIRVCMLMLTLLTSLVLDFAIHYVVKMFNTIF